MYRHVLPIIQKLYCSYRGHTLCLFLHSIQRWKIKTRLITIRSQPNCFKVVLLLLLLSKSQPNHNLTLTWLGLTRLSLCTPSTHHSPTTRNSTSARNNDPRGLKFYMQPQPAIQTTTQHNFILSLYYLLFSCFIAFPPTFLHNNIFLGVVLNYLLLNLFQWKLFLVVEWSSVFFLLAFPQ